MVSIWRFTSGENFFHISSSVKSTAGAISTRPASEPGFAPAAARRLSSRASSSASQPPIDEPTSTCGPLAKLSNTAALSSSQRPMVPSVNAPPDSPWPE